MDLETRVAVAIANEMERQTAEDGVDWRVTGPGPDLDFRKIAAAAIRATVLS
jgi:hypothetical protein